MEDKNGVCHVMEENEVDFQTRQNKPQENNYDRPRWLNGQCVLSVPTSSVLNPSFDLTLCRAKLERDGFQQIPVTDMEDPLRTALDVPSVRRYMVFNSALFHLIMAPVLYMVLWCAVFSTLHLYIPVSDYWVLCLSVSLVAIFLTSAIIYILHHSNKELFFVYWDISHCLRTLSETLEERSFVVNDTQNKLKKKMSHLVLVTEVTDADSEAGGSDVEHSSDEHRPLLRNEDTECSTASSQREANKVTTSYSLIPNASLPAQAKAYQLLVTYSSAYVKLLVSEQLLGLPNHRVHPQRNHCPMASLCLCQYIQTKVLL
ncbi:transmembrane protein 268 isoform X3 [Sphaeramia orbicularis]|uniref:transmembrane protein 268 isoform X3 n=1 Tax=Sphaeramia orbicularis TaxID=375764 RepID=UPI00118151DF|nr:transmembrane protein 268 isoform X3 [Sphaeramia orbicularis]